MALNPDKLARGLLEIADGKNFPATYVDAGKRWAHAYADYAADAMSFGIPAPPNSLAPNEAVLAGALAVVFATSFLTPQTANSMASALTAFWLSPPVTFGTGVVTAVAGTGALPSGLVSVWASNLASKLDAQSSCKAIAAVIHAFTLTVVTTTPNPAPPPPAFIGPIT